MNAPFGPEQVRKVSGAGGRLSAMAGEAVPSAFLLVPKGVRIPEPVVLDFRGGGASRSRIVLEEGGSAVVVECRRGQGESSASSVVEAGPDSRLAYFFCPASPSGAGHSWTQRVRLERGAALDHSSALFGEADHESLLEVELAGPGARSDVRAAVLGRGSRRTRASFAQRHLAPDTASDLLFRAALRGESRSAFHGLIRIEGGASGSGAFQSNRNLLLGSGARAESVPVLEILTDSVRCKHGVSTGPLDPEELHYLACRGIPGREAERMLIEGFFEPVLARSPLESLSSRLLLEVGHAS
jgi:Fe-S cluster assembly protein SufD